jgi:hypothetical protein
MNFKPSPFEFQNEDSTQSANLRKKLDFLLDLDNDPMFNREIHSMEHDSDQMDCTETLTVDPIDCAS